MSASERPACGSDRHIVPKNRPSSIGCDVGARPARGVPCASSRLALPTVSNGYAEVAMLAAWNQAKHAAATDVRQLQPADRLVQRRR